MNILPTKINNDEQLIFSIMYFCTCIATTLLIIGAKNPVNWNGITGRKISRKMKFHKMYKFSSIKHEIYEFRIFFIRKTGNL